MRGKAEKKNGCMEIKETKRQRKITNEPDGEIRQVYSMTWMQLLFFCSKLEESCL